MYDDYEYAFNMYATGSGWTELERINGWSVVYVGNDSKPGKLLRIINEKNLVEMSLTFFENKTIVKQ